MSVSVGENNDGEHSKQKRAVAAWHDCLREAEI
jgi:hypothetical protein